MYLHFTIKNRSRFRKNDTFYKELPTLLVEVKRTINTYQDTPMDRSSRSHILQQKNDKKIKYNDINITTTAKIKGRVF